MNFDLIIHSMLNSLMTSVVPLDVAINLCFVFINEGQKVLFRFMLATLKLNREVILKQKTKKDFMKTLRSS